MLATVPTVMRLASTQAHLDPLRSLCHPCLTGTGKSSATGVKASLAQAAAAGMKDPLAKMKKLSRKYKEVETGESVYLLHSIAKLIMRLPAGVELMCGICMSSSLSMIHKMVIQKSFFFFCCPPTTFLLDLHRSMGVACCKQLENSVSLNDAHLNMHS